MPYGIANRTGQVSDAEAQDILQQARGAGIDTLDTAMAYGESEARLGALGVRAWQVVTKLPAVDDHCADVHGWVQQSLTSSLERLRVDRLYALLLHRPAQLLGSRGDEIFRALTDVKSQGVVGKIGVSIYAPAELEQLWPCFRPDLVQAPFNVLDRRLSDSGWLARLRSAGVEVHVRSVFLQGLLLMSATDRPAAFRAWQDLWNRWDDWLRQQRLTALQAALSFVCSWSEVDRIVVGVDSLQHLREILAAYRLRSLEFPKHIQSDDVALINPSEWINREKM